MSNSIPNNQTPQNEDVWIIVPAYNEATRIGKTLDKLCSYYSNVVVVDDASRDDTRAVAETFPVWVLRHAINLGAGAATQTGVTFALSQGAQTFVTFDADGQHEVKDIAAMIAPIQAGEVDVTLGSRFLGEYREMPWTRWLILKGGILFTRLVSGISLTDTHNGLRAFSRIVAENVQIVQNRMSHCSEFLDKIQQHQFRYREIPVTVYYTQETLTKGQSSWNAVRIVYQFLLGRMVK